MQVLFVFSGRRLLSGITTIVKLCQSIEDVNFQTMETHLEHQEIYADRTAGSRLGFNNKRKPDVLQFVFLTSRKLQPVTWG